MLTNQKPTGRASSMTGGLSFGAGVFVALLIGGSALLAKLVDTETMKWENIGYGIMILLLAASWLGAAAAAEKIKRKRLPVCLGSGVIDIGILLAITALFFGGQYSSVGVTSLLVMGGSAAAGLMTPGRGRAGKVRKRRARTC